MKPRLRIATAHTPDGSEMELFQHDRNFSININGRELMNSLHHESELELARLGCAHLVDRKSPNILIGGLGLGFTLRQVLDMLSAQAKVVVGELLVPVVDWNRAFIGQINGNPLSDERVDVLTGNIVTLISRTKTRFDAILLDIDNGPAAMTDAGNRRLYGEEGIDACQRALCKQGVLAVWSAEPSKKYEKRLMACGFHVTRFRVPAYKGSKTLSRFIFVASEDKKMLPPGGGELRVQPRAKKGTRGGGQSLGSGGR
jgi:spermidine synthase